MSGAQRRQRSAAVATATSNGRLNIRCHPPQRPDTATTATVSGELNADRSAAASPRLLGVSGQAAPKPAPVGRLPAGTPEALILRGFPAGSQTTLILRRFPVSASSPPASACAARGARAAASPSPFPCPARRKASMSPSPLASVCTKRSGLNARSNPPLRPATVASATVSGESGVRIDRPQARVLWAFSSSAPLPPASACIKCSRLNTRSNPQQRLSGSPHLLGVSDQTTLEPASLGRFRASRTGSPYSTRVCGRPGEARSTRAGAWRRHGGPPPAPAYLPNGYSTDRRIWSVSSSACASLAR